MPDDDIPPISESPEPVVRPRPPKERPQRTAVLKVEAAALLRRPVNGAWRNVLLRHASGSAVKLLVAWDRDGTRFVGLLDGGVLVELDAYPGRG